MGRPTKRFAAMLVAGFAGLATALTGCGGNEPSKTATIETPGTTVASSPATVDFNDPNDVKNALSTIEVDVAAPEPIERDRAGGVEGLIFPTWPSGEVRKAGLSTYRIDVAPEFDGKASVKFMMGRKVLYEAPFNPANLSTETPIPPVVIEAVKAGDRVTWGVYPEGKKVKPATLDFTITEKAAAQRKLSQGDTNKALSPMARAFAKANVLQNNGFLSESVQVFFGIGKADPSVSSVYAPIVGMLRRLHLKNTPLFHDAMAKATAVTPAGPARQAFSVGGGASNAVGTATPKSGEFAGTAPNPFASTPAAGKGGFTPRNNGLTKNATDSTKTSKPTDVVSPLGEGASRAASAMLFAAADARRRADEAAAHAKLLTDLAADTKAKSDAAAQNAANLLQKVLDLKSKVNDPSLSDAERAQASAELALATAAYNQAKLDAEAAAVTAASAEGAAFKASNDAATLNEQAAQLAAAAQAAASAVGAGAPGSTPPSPTDPKADPNALTPMPTLSNEQVVAGLQTLLNATQGNLNSANLRLSNAQAAVNTAQAAFVAASDADKPAALAALNAAKAEAQAAQTAQQEAQAAMLDAAAALDAATPD